MKKEQSLKIPAGEVAPDAVAAVPEEWKGQYRRLLAVRDRLLEDGRQLLRDATYPVGSDGTHWADLATDEFERDLDLSLLTSDQNALLEVEEALRRIERGIYGVCEMTGEPIPKARLRAVPWTRFTAEAELELERKGLVGRPHFSELGHVETEPHALSRELERMEAPNGEIPGGSLEKLTEMLATSEEQPALEAED